MSSTPAVLEATDVWAGYGGPPVLAGVDLTLRPGEAVGLLGRSGVGKSTLVEILGGGQRPTQGHVTFDGAPVAKTPRRRRKDVRARLRTVHQNGIAGVDVQRTVEETILDAFKEARKAGRTTDNDVEAALAVVGLPIRFVTRRVGTLSGGERQRVALARALAPRPRLLLLDEPLSALDLKLRQHMRAELRALQKRTGVTFIYITHDQSEALAMSDRIAVMSAGVLQQVGTPRELYDNPATPFVATFVGENNAIAGKVTTIADGIAAVETPLGSFRGRANGGIKAGDKVKLYVRPEALVSGGAGENVLTSTVDRIDFEGAFGLAYGRLQDGSQLIASIPSTDLANAPAIGSQASFGFATQHAVVLPDG